MGENAIAQHWGQAWKKARQLPSASDHQDVLALIYALIAADYGEAVDKISWWEVRYQLLDPQRLHGRLAALLPGPDGFGPATVEGGRIERVYALSVTGDEHGEFTGPAPLEGRLWRLWAALQAPHGTLYADTLTSEELDAYDRAGVNRGYVASGKTAFEHAVENLAKVVDRQVLLPASGTPGLGAPVAVISGVHQGRSGWVCSVVWSVDEERHACAEPPVSFSVRFEDRKGDVVDVASGDVEVLPEWDPRFVVAYAGQRVPTSWVACVLVAGASADSEWHQQVLSALQEGWTQVVGRLVVLVTQHADGRPADPQSGWLRDAYRWADEIIADCPSGTALPPKFGLPDNASPPGAERLILHAVNPDAHMLDWSARHAVPLVPSARAASSTALGRIPPTHERTGGMRQVPLSVFRNSGFERWSNALFHARSVVDGATVDWTTQHPEYPQNADWWSLRARIRHPDQRVTTERVTGRTGRVSLVVWVRRPQWTDSEVLLLRDRKSPAAYLSTHPTRFPQYLPGVDRVPQTSVEHQDAGQQDLAAVAAGLGIAVGTDRMLLLGHRAESAPVASLHSAVAVELSQVEFDDLKALHCAAGATDRSEVPQFHRVADLLSSVASPLCDWATLGVIIRAVVPTYPPAGGDFRPSRG